MVTSEQTPVYKKNAYIFMGLAAMIAVLYVGRPVFVPLIGATLVAIVLSPFVDFMVRKRINKIVAIAIAVVLVVLLAGGLALLVASQVANFSEAWPMIKKNVGSLLYETKIWFSTTSGVSTDKINSWVGDVKGDMMQPSSSAISETLVSVGSFAVVLVVIPVYIFLVLFYRPLLLGFIHKIFDSGNKREQVTEVLSSIKTTIKSYLVGLLIEAAVVGTIYTVGLLIIGIDYALLLGLLAALLNLIPYVGQIIAGSLSMLMALATKTEPHYALIVLAFFMFMQFFDNNYLLPRIVASKVKINALVSIVVVIAGNLLWGVPGMFLSIPLTAIAKVIFDHSQPLKPWGFLLGDTVPGGEGLKKKRKK